jgi:ADP-heptose:LPS heptosyltransferase
LTVAATAAASPPEPGARPRVLVSRLRYVGDAILSLPLLGALRAALPAAEIHYMAEPATLEVLAGQPEIDVRWPVRHGAGAALALAARLRARRFDAVIDLFCNPRSALLVAASGAPVRIGEARRGRRYAYTSARRLVPGRSAIDQHLDALRGLGLVPPPASRPVLHLAASERAAGAAAWAGVGGAGVLLHVGASHPDKEWPHAAAFATLLAAAGIPAALSTAPARPQPSLAAARASGLPLFAAMPLREFLGVVAAATAVVAVDGAVVHAAVALGRPTVALFGPTDAGVWFPYERFGAFRVLRAAAACGPCSGRPGAHRCMAALAPGAVRTALAGVSGRTA